jgi:hypothetical protein
VEYKIGMVIAIRIAMASPADLDTLFAGIEAIKKKVASRDNAKEAEHALVSELLASGRWASLITRETACDTMILIFKTTHAAYVSEHKKIHGSSKQPAWLSDVYASRIRVLHKMVAQLTRDNYEGESSVSRCPCDMRAEEPGEEEAEGEGVGQDVTVSEHDEL